MRVLVVLFLLIATPALAWQLTFTAPGFDRATRGSCPLGCVDTTQSPAPCVDAAAFDVWRHRQAPTWVAKHDSMLASPAVWSRYWPAVVREADYLPFASVQTSAAAAGKPVSIAMADTIATGWFWFVVTRDSSGNRACKSNEIAR
jgi:hypothetical protein